MIENKNEDIERKNRHKVKQSRKRNPKNIRLVEFGIVLFKSLNNHHGALYNEIYDCNRKGVTHFLFGMQDQVTHWNHQS